MKMREKKEHKHFSHAYSTDWLTEKEKKKILAEIATLNKNTYTHTHNTHTFTRPKVKDEEKEKSQKMCCIKKVLS